MTAAVLATGPSLALLDRLPACDVSIGIKRAAERFACDWAACLDIPLVGQLQFAGDPKLLTRAAYRPKYTKLPGANVEDLGGPHRFDLYTVTACLVLAAHLGASDIDVYGCDWAENAPDFDGYVPDQMNRGPQRWELERTIWQSTVDWLAARGHRVTRRQVALDVHGLVDAPAGVLNREPRTIIQE